MYLAFVLVKGLWDKRPDWWDAHVPFFDPNNRKRLKHEAGMPAKKPTKDELVLMLEYLFRLCKVTIDMCVWFFNIYSLLISNLVTPVT